MASGSFETTSNVHQNGFHRGAQSSVASLIDCHTSSLGVVQPRDPSLEIGFLTPDESLPQISKASISALFDDDKGCKGFANVRVTSASSPSSFHCVFDGLSLPGRLNELQVRMTAFYAASPKENWLRERPACGSVVACAVKSDGGLAGYEWHRAVVLHPVSVQEYLVFLADTGQELTVHFKQLRQLRRDFARVLPAQAIECCLAGIQPLQQATKWPLAVASRFKAQISAQTGDFVGIWTDS